MRDSLTKKLLNEEFEFSKKKISLVESDGKAPKIDSKLRYWKHVMKPDFDKIESKHNKAMLKDLADAWDQHHHAMTKLFPGHIHDKKANPYKK